MVTNKINVAAIQGMRRHAVEVSRLIKSLKPVVKKKSKNRRLLLLRKTLVKFNLAYSWWSDTAITINAIPYGRPGITIHVETLLFSGVSYPVEYYLIQQSVTFNKFSVPCGTDYELLKKLYRFKLLSYDEVVKPMLAIIQPVTQ